jgi:hypothetical protein
MGRKFGRGCLKSGDMTPAGPLLDICALLLLKILAILRGRLCFDPGVAGLAYRA